MGERIGHQGQSSQDNEGAEESVGKSNQQTGEESSLHEFVAEGFEKRVQHA
jgi:hypothetical protein